MFHRRECAGVWWGSGRSKLTLTPSLSLSLSRQVVIALDAASFGTWEGAAFAPEAKFLEAVKAVPGVTTVETQTYTLMPM